MQYLLIDRSDTLTDIARIVGQRNVDLLLTENGLKRTPKIGQEWYKMCSSLIEQTPQDVSASRKSTLLNSLTHSEEIFEKACLLDEDGWRVFSACQAFPDALRIPESIELPYSNKVIGAKLGDVTSTLGVGRSTINGMAPSSNYNSYLSQTASTDESVDPITYRAVMNGLKTSPQIDSGIFNKVNTSLGIKLDNSSSKSRIESVVPQYAFNLPWGKIQMYSTVLKEMIDFPAYPETIDTSRSASYTGMPDTIFQYEPWIVYQSSGPREQALDFHLHRDLWTGDHTDGNANKLIRFCEANTFPDYKGSAVFAPRVRLYIDGSLFISGVLTNTSVKWSGPLGLDNWYLEFTLSLMIQEVSETALNTHAVRSFGLKGV